MTKKRAMLAAAVSVAVFGCGGAEPSSMTTQKLNQIAQGNTSDDERAKIKSALEKANIKGEIELIEDSGNFWTVELGSPPGPEGKGGRKTGGLMFRPAYTVDKTTLQVTKAGKKKGALD